MKTLDVTISPSQVVVAASEQISCDLGGEEVILDLSNGVYYGLNPIGSRIWSLIQAPQPVQTIIDILLCEYDVDREECTRQVYSFLADLSDRRLIKIDS